MKNSSVLSVRAMISAAENERLRISQLKEQISYLNRIFTSVNVLNLKMKLIVTLTHEIKSTKLLYAPMRSTEHQVHIVRDKCFDCDQKEHT